MIQGTIKPLHDKVLVTDMNFGETKTKGGIVIQADDGKVEGIHPRWGRVVAVGPEQTDISVGEYVLVEHGRWTRGFEYEIEAGKSVTARWVEVDAILVVSDSPTDMF